MNPAPSTPPNLGSYAKAACLFAALLLSGAILSGCTPFGVVLGAGAAGGSMALEERGFEASARDKITGTTIEKRLIDSSFTLFRNVGVTVIEDRVYLTGVVADQDQRIEAVEQQISQLHRDLPETYMRRDDYVQSFSRIEQKIDAIWEYMRNHLMKPRGD